MYADAASSQGTTLSQSSVQSAVAHAIAVGGLPTDANGIYVVYGDAATAMSGLCTSFCGWHTYGSVNGAMLKFAFIGNAGRCESAVRRRCAPCGRFAPC